MSITQLKHAQYRKFSGANNWSGQIVSVSPVNTEHEEKVVADLTNVLIETDENDPQMNTTRIYVLVENMDTEGNKFTEAKYTIGGYTMNKSGENKIVITGFLYSSEFYNRGTKKLDKQTTEIMPVKIVCKSL